MDKIKNLWYMERYIKMKYEITSQNTKRMLANTLISLMKKKSLSKISISEIVKECQINRKTFYYHFQDIYELLEWHLAQEVSALVPPTLTMDELDIRFCNSFYYISHYNLNDIQNREFAFANSLLTLSYEFIFVF